ncbi:hypothetical protein M885DRAFT_559424 [Pelagophyceae sp. CCMP2097]|nr:hypothetical protein M885DRAFT_559424 [Pelagophyceae sp. CCMP2097]
MENHLKPAFGDAEIEIERGPVEAVAARVRQRKVLDLGFTVRSPLDAFHVLPRLTPLWCGSSYDVLRQNCVSFCLVLAGELGIETNPQWTHALADGAARLEDRARRLKHAVASAGRKRLGGAVDDGVIDDGVFDVSVETRTARAAIRRRARPKWDVLPLRDATTLRSAAVLFLKQDSDWRPLRAYGQSRCVCLPGGT